MINKDYRKLNEVITMGKNKKNNQASIDLKKIKHAIWLKEKESSGQLNQSSASYEGNKRKAMYDRNSKAAKKDFRDHSDY